MKILYLYEEVMGYTQATLRALATLGAELHVIHWDHKKITPFELAVNINVKLYKRSQLSRDEIINIALNLSPALTVVSGWNDKDYLLVSRALRQKSFQVVLALDGQWKGTVRQHFARFLGKINFFNNFYSYAWVAGVHQYEYALKLGFSRRNIVYDLYSADLSLFQSAYNKRRMLKYTNYPHRFLFVGRFEKVKGIDTLINAWKILGNKKRDWELHLIGNGSLKTKLHPPPDVIIKDFMQPERLIEEIAEAGCFVLPSQSEPWGVVVHEFAASGVPMILSDVVGAASTFLISGANGYLFKFDDAQILANQMEKIINLPDKQLISMADLSHFFSRRITPLTSALNLLSVIECDSINIFDAFIHKDQYTFS